MIRFSFLSFHVEYDKTLVYMAMGDRRRRHRHHHEYGMFSRHRRRATYHISIFFFFVASVSFHSALAGNQPSPSAPYRRHRAIEVKCDIVRQSMFENKFHWKYSGIVCNCGIGRIRAYIKIVLCVCIKNLFYFVESFGRDAVRHSNPIGASTAHSRQPALRCRHMRLTRRAESLFDFHFSSRTTSVPHHGHAALSPRLTLHTYIQ